MISWDVRVRRGSAGALHADPSEPVDRRSATWCEVDRPALVLGSAQPDSTIDGAACAAAGVEIVRRRSGGGAVLMVPGEMLWLDVLLPRDDALWSDDVGRAMWWLGDVWVDALADCGVVGSEVHRGALRHSPWSRIVCFDGLGAGEVVVGAAKVVGISQRRTRGWARLQSSVHLVWRPESMVSLLAEPRPTPGDLATPFVVPVAAARIRAAVESALGRIAA